jgi:hypothetical protein
MKEIKAIIYCNFRVKDLGVDGRIILQRIFRKYEGFTDLMDVGQDTYR